MYRLMRNELIQVAGLLAAISVMPGLLLAGQASGNRPNIVLILADDMGYGDLGCQNPQSKIPTPNLDRLAGQGIRLTDAHSPSAVCSPTRYGILTGRYCWRTRLKSGVLWTWDPPLIEPDRLTVPKLLKQHGYATACIGKWHLGWDWPTVDGKLPKRNSPAKNVDFRRPIANGPTTRGFDYYFGTDVPNFPPYCFIENDRTVGIPTEQKPGKMFGLPGPMLPGWKLVEILPGLTEKAVGYIDSQAAASQENGTPRRPFFLYFPLTAPHTPIVPAAEFRGKSGAGTYGDFVHQVDWTVGQVMAAIERNGLARDTLIIFTSDNGSPGRNGKNASGPTGSVVKEFGHDPSGGLRGMKADAWDGGHRVPFVARWPGHIGPGTTSDQTVCLADLMATFAAILGTGLPDDAGLPEDAGEDSYNILPVLLGQQLDEPIRPATVHHSGNGLFCVRQGPWKLILGLGSGGFSRPSRVKPEPGGPRGQLYNLADDTAEAVNLYQKHPEVVARLTALLEKYKKEGRSRP